MDTHEFDFLCNEVLTLIETEEAHLLNWGFTNVESDLQRLLPDLLTRLPDSTAEIWQKANAEGSLTVTNILDNLNERMLVRRMPNGTYRTRFAETIRLLSMLKQRFSEDDWATASRLVSDIRIQLQRRRYPKRDVTLDSLLSIINENNFPTAYAAAVTQLLSSEHHNPLKIAAFQQEAILQHLNALQEQRVNAIVIGAGTGAGKTKAFYIPAMAYLVDTLMSQRNSPRPFVKVMAIYPRNELLKDQLAEAYSEARKLDGYLHENRLREITIGAYYGDTPETPETLQKFASSSWKRKADGLVCPYLACPEDGGELVWHYKDLDSSRTRLVCADCGYELDERTLLLTRGQMIDHPPDILFTTTEMLNQRMGRVKEHHLFGIHAQPSPPHLLLLDEIHTYEGTNGAQIAYLLRRWQHACGYTSGNKRSPLVIVGLSATLTQASTFFSKLTGVSESRVQYIEPQEHEMVEEGIEYNLVLKGDPVSMTALLSTSVQTVMLLGRVLDPSVLPQQEPLSRWAYGQKIFAFSDKLDVVNRWTRIQHDAEHIRQLAQYRLWTDETPTKMRQIIDEQGQDWRFFWAVQTPPGALPVANPLAISRTTSQDTGVENAKVIVATSSLEVGFNDRAVGAVIQHKTPRSMASFLQRKGRAGRDRRTRPWMVVVTSAYGRDRWAFQHAENLFNPVLPPLNLPIENDYVRKIQASYVLMDWLAQELRQAFSELDTWRLFSSYYMHQEIRNGSASEQRKKQRQAVAERLQDVLNGGVAYERLKLYLQQALALDEDNVQLILWGDPRSLVLEVIPSALRELETGWQEIVYVSSDKRSLIQSLKYPKQDGIRAPLPAFVPPNLFSDLNLPEVQLLLEDNPTGHEETRQEALSMLLAMREFTPGKPNERFAKSRSARSGQHNGSWIPLPDLGDRSRLRCSLEALEFRSDTNTGHIVFDKPPKHIEIDGESIAVYRPRRMRIVRTPQHVAMSSNAFLIWRSHFAPQVRGIVSTLDLGTENTWQKHIIDSAEAYLQANRSWVDITRLAIGVEANTRFTTGQVEQRFRLDFEDFGQAGNRAGIGFTLSVDALRFTLKALDTGSLMISEDWKQLFQSMAPHLMLYKLRTDPRLSQGDLQHHNPENPPLQLNAFEIGWLWQLEYTMVVEEAIQSGISLADAAVNISTQREMRVDDVLERIFNYQRYLESEHGSDEDIRNLGDRLRGWLQNSNVQSALSDATEALWNDQDSELPFWLQAVYRSSVGSALFHSVTQLVDDIDPDALTMDIEGNSIWISEGTPGGIGLIQRIASSIAQRPREFFFQLDDAIRYCERENLALQLETITSLLEQGNLELLAAFRSVRKKRDLPSLDKARNALQETLEAQGIPSTRQLMVALNAKFLRPNSSPQSDQLIIDLVNHWREEMVRLGCEIDMRVMASAALSIPKIQTHLDALLENIGLQNRLSTNQLYNLLQSLMWFNCVDSCPDCLEYWSFYQNFERPSRRLVQSVLNPTSLQIAYDSEGWQDLLRDYLISKHQAQVTCLSSQLTDCKAAIAELLTVPLDAEYQLFYPAVERIERRHHTGNHREVMWTIHFIVRELVGY